MGDRGVQENGEEGRGSRWPAWIYLLTAATLVLSIAEGALLLAGTGFFGSGFNSVAVSSGWQIAVFGLASFAVDAGLQLALWVVAVPLLGWFGITGLRAWWGLFVVGAGLPTLIAAYRYNVYAIAGDAFSVALLRHTPLSSSSSMVQELLAAESLPWVVAATCGLLVIGIVGRLLGRWEALRPGLSARLALPSSRSALVGALLLLLSGALLTRIPGETPERIRYGLERKSADIAVSVLLDWGTDVDGDGFGPLSEIADPAPCDAARFPYALEVPGNGIDENGLAGDLAASLTAPSPVRAPLPSGAIRPHVLLIYLESFRHDLLGMRVNGRAVTPFLDQLIAEGASTDQAWTHSAWTLSSRTQLFTGAINARPGVSTLIDDFKALGYEVAHFSGQDESYGGSEALLGVERADRFYDARQDKERRSSRSTAPVSLQVSWKVLMERVDEYLRAYDGDRPLFLYVNFTDTHFPYLHGDLDDILGVPPLERSGIRAARARQVFEGYANTAANVDRGAQRVVESFRRATSDEDHGILVLADHGEAFYEHGRLGHGQGVDIEETRIPMVVWGLGGEWPVPLGPTDVRGLLRRNLTIERGDGPPLARFVPDSERRILQYAPSLARPTMIALRGLDGVDIYDFVEGTAHHEASEAAAASAAEGAAPPVADELIWWWEAVRSGAAPSS